MICSFFLHRDGHKGNRKKHEIANTMKHDRMAGSWKTAYLFRDKLYPKSFLWKPIFRVAQSCEIFTLCYLFRHALNYRKPSYKNLYRLVPLVRGRPDYQTAISITTTLCVPSFQIPLHRTEVGQTIVDFLIQFLVSAMFGSDSNFIALSKCPHICILSTGALHIYSVSLVL